MIRNLNTLEDVLDELHQIANPEVYEFKRKKYAIVANNSLGISQKNLKEIAKRIGRNDDLALALFNTGIYEARILTSKVYHYKNIQKIQMESWASTFENWEITDSFSMDFFARTDLAYSKIFEWSEREEEFVKRSAFAMMAAYSSKHKNKENEVFESFFPLIIKHSNDDRNFVKKAVNWALRSIGKRNIDLKKKAIVIADDLMNSDLKSAQWIGKDASKELKSDKVSMQDHPRHIYRI